MIQLRTAHLPLPSDKHTNIHSTNTQCRF